MKIKLFWKNEHVYTFIISHDVDLKNAYKAKLFIIFYLRFKYNNNLLVVKVLICFYAFFKN